MKALMTVAEVAAETPWGQGVIRDAIRSTDPSTFPPPLRAKRGPRGQYVVRDVDLVAWIESMPDA